MKTYIFKTLTRLNAEREKSYKELDKRIDREKELGVIQQKMTIKRALQGKNQFKPKMIQKGTKTSAPIYKFKYERKK